MSTPPRTLGLVGARGGCGTTTLCANLAACAARTESTALVDFDFTRGDLAGLLDLTPAGTVAQIVALEGPVDATAVTGATMRHDAGFDVLCQPTDLSLLTAPALGHSRQLIDELGRSHDRTFYDLGAAVDIATVAALMTVDRVVIVAANRIPDQRNVRRLRELLMTLNRSLDDVRLVISPWYPDELALDEIETHTGLSVAAVVRRDPAAFHTLELEARLPVVDDADRPYAMDVEQVWTAIRDIPVPLVPPARPFWPWAR